MVQSPLIMRTITFTMPSSKQIRIATAVFGVVLLAVIFWGPRFADHVAQWSAGWFAPWQAVYLVDGDLYVGRIRTATEEELRLADAYFVRPVPTDGQQSLGQTMSMQIQGGGVQSFSLIPWGVSQPLKSSGILTIPRSSVLFWETLDGDAEIVRQISAARR